MLTIPAEFQRALSSDAQTAGSILSTIAAIDTLFSHRSLPLFPEYTDHSVRHMQEILQTAQVLIPEKVLVASGRAPRAPFTPTDVGVLVAAVLFHDIGMHLTEDGFFHLLESGGPLIAELDRKSWATLWSDFSSEARRWDANRLEQILGSPEPVMGLPTGKARLMPRDRLLIGEFVRRHHARMAHEAVVFGIPGVGGRHLLLANPPTPEFAGLCGLVARSHGLALRSAAAYARAKYPRSFQGIHPVYLMAVLRISDYLQVQSSRAPRARLQIEALMSPLSNREWRAHAAVRNISYDEDDPESIFVTATPSNVDDYLHLRDLLAGLQLELDTAWAVLGEEYGRYPRLRHLRLTLRRVQSNLDNPETIASDIQYLPMRCVLETAPAELLNLLVAPLYGDDPNAALRELIQNAVDACRELDDLLSQMPGTSRPEHSQRSDISITLDQRQEDPDWTFSISDRGVGMTPETVRNYFLKAGASFRNSDAWKSQHTVDTIGPRVLRTGRFGIGVLASFLLGSKIEVTTRHVSNHQGVSFTVTLSDKLVELRKHNRPVGTTISVRLTPEMGNRLHGLLSRRDRPFGQLPDQVYLFSKPSLSIHVNGARIKLGIRWPSPDRARTRPTWQPLNVPGYQDVFWNYSGRAGRLACNGFAVMQHYDWQSPWQLPNVSVIDPHGQFPLTLTRNAIIGETLPFDVELLRDVSENFVASLLAERTAPHVSDGLAFLPTIRARHPAIHAYDGSFDYVFLTHGVTLARRELVTRAGVNVVVQYYGASARCIPWPVPQGVGAMFTLPHSRRVRRFGLKTDTTFAVGDPFGAGPRLRGAVWPFLHAPLRILARNPSITWEGRELSDFTRQALDHGCVLVAEAGAGQSPIETDTYVDLLRLGHVALIVEYHLDALETTATSMDATDDIVKIIDEHLGPHLVIPYDLTERQRQFPAAFEALSSHLAKHAARQEWASARRRESQQRGRHMSSRRLWP